MSPLWLTALALASVGPDLHSTSGERVREAQQAGPPGPHAVGVGPAAAGAHHQGIVQGDTVQWHSTWRSSKRCVTLAAPFEPPAPYAVAERDGQTLLCRPDDHGWSLHYERPFPADELDVPLLADTLQRVDVKGARFESPDGSITKHLKVWTTPGVTRKQRQQLDRALPKAPATARIYLAPQDAVAGQLRPPGASQGVVFGALGVFLAVSAGMVGVYRVLERGARRDRVERYLRDEVHTATQDPLVGADDP